MKGERKRSEHRNLLDVSQLRNHGFESKTARSEKIQILLWAKNRTVCAGGRLLKAADDETRGSSLWYHSHGASAKSFARHVGAILPALVPLVVGMALSSCGDTLVSSQAHPA